MPHAHDDPFEEPTTELDLAQPCAMCGRRLWSDGLPPAQEGHMWICGDCDQARNFRALDLD